MHTSSGRKDEISLKSRLVFFLRLTFVQSTTFLVLPLPKSAASSGVSHRHQLRLDARVSAKGYTHPLIAACSSHIRPESSFVKHCKKISYCLISNILFCRSGIVTKFPFQTVPFKDVINTSYQCPNLISECVRPRKPLVATSRSFFM